jgi:hypothetical protein
VVFLHGQDVKEIKKLAPGKFVWSGTAVPVAAPAPAAKAQRPVEQKAPAQELNLKEPDATKGGILDWLRAPENRASR